MRISQYIPTLGSGYSDDEQLPARVNCFLATNVTYAGGDKSIISLGNAISFYGLQSSLNVDVSASFSVSLFSLNFAAQYARYAEIKRYEQSFYFIESVTLPTAIVQPAGYGPNALNAAGRAAYALGPQNLRKVCGDKLVQQVHLGAYLAVTMKIIFSSYEDSQTFQANAGINWGSIASALAAIKEIVSNNGLDGSCEISALQFGGYPAQLAKLFNSSSGLPYFVSSCSLSNLNACDQIIDAILNYAANIFPGQIDFKNGTVIGSANATGWTMMDVSEFGLNAGQSVLNKEIIAARTDLGNLYKAKQANLTFVGHLLNTPFVNSMTADTVKDLRIANTALISNLAMLSNSTSDGPLGCYLDPTQCPAIRQNLLAKMTPVDTGFLNQMNHGFMLQVQTTIGCECTNYIENSALFPINSNSTIYYTTQVPGAQSTIVINGGVLNAIAKGINCPPALKLTGYDRYAFDDCAHGAADYACESAFGMDGYPCHVGCGTNGCTGAMVFIVSDNPL